MEYELIKSRRRTISIIIKPPENFMQNGARLIVRAPFNASKGKIEDVLREKESWILRKMRQVEEQSLSVSTPDFTLNSTVLFIGKEYIIDLAAVKSVQICGNKIILPQKTNDIKAKILSLYRKKCKELFFSRLDYFARLMEENYLSLRISGARSRWGSCSKNGKINLSWRLILCPDFVIDYVIVHELCHIKIKNHKKEFYRRLAAILPEYKTAVKYLKENNAIMQKY